MLVKDGFRHQEKQKECGNPRANHSLNKHGTRTPLLLCSQTLVRLYGKVPPSQRRVVDLLVPGRLTLGRQAVVEEELLVLNFRNADETQTLRITSRRQSHSNIRVCDHVVVRHLVHKLLGRDIPIWDEVGVQLSLLPCELVRNHHHVWFQRGTTGVGRVVYEMTNSDRGVGIYCEDAAADLLCWVLSMMRPS